MSSNNSQDNPPQFDAEALLADILAVLKKHNLPIQSAALDISMHDADFDAKIPHLRSYKSGIYHRPMLIDNVPMLLDAKRRIPFETVVTWLEENLLPLAKAKCSEFKQAFPQYKIELSVSRPKDTIIQHHAAYLIKLEFRLNDHLHDDYVILQLSIAINQKEATSYPRFTAFVAWLVDEESNDDWGLDVLHSHYPWNDEITEHRLELFKIALPEYFRHFKQAIEKRIKEAVES